VNKYKKYAELLIQYGCQTPVNNIRCGLFC